MDCLIQPVRFTQLLTIRDWVEVNRTTPSRSILRTARTEAEQRLQAPLEDHQRVSWCV